MDDVTIEEGNFVTKTVSGFLDFTTTVGNTVMVFTPEGGVKRKKRTVASRAGKCISQHIYPKSGFLAMNPAP